MGVEKRVCGGPVGVWFERGSGINSFLHLPSSLGSMAHWLEPLRWSVRTCDGYGFKETKRKKKRVQKILDRYLSMCQCIGIGLWGLTTGFAIELVYLLLPLRFFFLSFFFLFGSNVLRFHGEGSGGSC
jgi:hypothetical protein